MKPGGKVKIDRILDRPDWSWDYEKMYTRPSIPSRKLAAAIGSYAPEVHPADVIVLLDDTLFGGAKEGLLITNEAIYAKQKFEDPKRIAFAAVTEIKPGTNSRMFVNGQVFFKADIVEHFAVGALASRLASVATSLAPAAPTSARNAAASAAKSGASLPGRFTDIHTRAMRELRRDVGDDALLFDGLMERQIQAIAGELGQLRETVRAGSRVQLSDSKLDAETAELALLLFLVLHYYALSKLPEDFKRGMGDTLPMLYAMSEVYKDAFRENFAAVFAQDFEFDEESLAVIPLMFFHRDGSGDFELKVPRHEALQLMMEKLRMPPAASRQLMQAFDAQVAWWYAAIVEMMEDEDEDEDGEDDQVDEEDEVTEARVDYYDILGVRPSASANEIALAFKGRRTQYHPDRYAQEDADTIVWATAKMQEVNQAHAVLSDAGRRSQFDRQKGQGARHPQSSPKPAPKPPAPNSRPPAADPVDGEPHIYDYLRRISLSGDDRRRVHLNPNIPDGKMANAILARDWAERTNVGRMLLLLDDTLHLGGKEGLVITDQLISFKSLFETSTDCHYANGFNGGFECSGKTISRMGKTYKTFVHVSADSVHAVVGTINAFLADRHRWHERAAEAGRVHSQFFLSSSCHHDPAAELKWLTMAAENGHMSAQHNMGMHYMYKDKQAAFHWFSKAAAQGSENSRDRLLNGDFAAFRNRA